MSAEKSRQIAIFDFDDTLMAGDSFRLFIRWLLMNAPHLLPTNVPRWASKSQLMAADKAVFKCVLLSLLKTRFREKWAVLVARFCAEVLRPRLLSAMVEMLRTTTLTHATFVVSASPQFYLDGLALDFGVPIVGTPIHVVGNEDGLLVSGPNCVGLEKVHRLIACGYIGESDVIDIVATDHIRDLPLLLKAARPIAVRPEPRLRRMAAERAWTVMDC